MNVSTTEPAVVHLREKIARVPLQQWLKSRCTVLNVVFALATAVYVFFFWKSVPRWFHPGWTTDDALQQLYPFHAVLNPELFQGDLVTEVMKGYLAPLHYWLCYVVTWLCGDPIMMGHWVMLLQACSAALFLFLAVQHAAGSVPAFFSVIWLLHTRQIMQRMTAGLPRGWAAAVLVATLYFVLKKSHKATLVVLLLGCLLHPPATMIAALTYGFVLVWGVLWEKSRKLYLKPLVQLVILSPIYIGITFYVVHRPEHVGQMVTYEEAQAMPEFQHPDGRFPFVPLSPVLWDLRVHGFQSFVDRFYNPGRFWKRNVRYVVLAALLLLVLVGIVRKRHTIPVELWCYVLATLAVYFASRLMAFRLYVPNRHLQFPMAIFFIALFSVGVWRAFYLNRGQSMSQPGDRRSFQATNLNCAWLSAVALLVLGVFIYIGSGTGLYGDGNFNYARDKKGKVFAWLAEHTPQQALIAGHPTFIDGVMLFGKRRGFITTETAHPFYKGYNAEVQRRLELSLRAHFARDLSELLAVLEPAEVDYFVFERKRFYPWALK
ncbi:hypothetical protein OAO01_06730, partial [Oligoflexia bacterium]|nr:hypothetical protein [Oligoflexia bacterium]